MLKLIADAPRHGYDLIREIEGLTGGGYAPSPGVVYPTLSMLDEMGLIEEQQSEGAKKRFAASEEGRAHLAENSAIVDALFARLAAVGAESERTDGAPIRRAMGNLRQVLQHRLMREDVNEDTLHDVAALIDEAAQKIERLKRAFRSHACRRIRRAGIFSSLPSTGATRWTSRCRKRRAASPSRTARCSRCARTARRSTSR
jgi:DNA-binding PadR family transcriptional regulator